MATADIQIKEANVFKRIGKGFVNFFTKSVPTFFTKTLPGAFVKLGSGIAQGCKNLVARFRNGSLGTKISHLVFGFGNLYHGQIIKGLIYLALQVGIILFMVLCPTVVGPNNVLVPMGWKALANLGLKGAEPDLANFDWDTGAAKVTDNSQLYLLFGLVTIAVLAIYVLLWNSSIKSSVIADTAVKEGKKPTSLLDDLKALLDGRFHILMLTPTCLAALAFTILPTIFMICMAFTDYNTIDMSAEARTLFHWTGFENVGNMFSGKSALGEEISARFFPVLGWTLIWAVFATFTCYFGGIIVALLINKKGLKFKKVYRTFFILTIAVPQFISLLAVRNLLSGAGPINSMLMSMFGLEKPISFLGLESSGNDPVLAKVMIIVVNLWLGVPYTMLMTSGILMNIPADLYEAARVDGTSPLKMFFKITLPYIVFVTTPYLISSFIGNINSFNTIFLLTGGGPSVGAYKAGETDLLVTWLYKLTIDSGEYNTGAVIGIMTFIITSIITLVTYRNSKAYKEEDTFQ